MKTPIIQDKTLRPLNTYRFSAIKEFLTTEQGKRRDSEISAVLCYAALAMSDDEKQLHEDVNALASAVVDMGISLQDDELVEIATYVGKIIALSTASEVDVEGKVK